MWWFCRIWNKLGNLHVKRNSLYKKIMIQKPLWNKLISYLEVLLYIGNHLYCTFSFIGVNSCIKLRTRYCLSVGNVIL